MSASKHIDKICIAGAVLLLLSAALLWNGEALGLKRASAAPAYIGGLFDTSRVHTVDIVMDDWEGFLAGCTDEEYVPCAVVIDGDACRNVGFRAKGNTSLAAVEQMGSSRYSFKIEFDHYEKGKRFQGLDKLCLNNLVQDNTCLKDYLCYTMMADAGVAAPACSFAFLTVNGEDWGLYLMAEGVEESFLQRNYGRDYGALYKPGAEQRGQRAGGEAPPAEQGAGRPDPGMPPAGGPSGQRPDGPPQGDIPAGGQGAFGGIPAEGGSSRDLCLQYIGEDPADYPNIFDHAKTAVTSAEQRRLIGALKELSEGQASAAVDTEQVMRYFAVHSFVCNDDSYTGVMAHNYYLYEEDGHLSMIPWDYNLAFGGFGMADAAKAVNAPIDTPVTGAALSDRPMVSWIFDNAEDTARYHEIYGDFVRRWFTEGKFEEVVAQAAALIAPCVERDPTKFCTVEEFERGAAALRTFCRLRAESVLVQLEGSVPSTAEGQAEAPELLIDAEGLALEDMGGIAAARGGDGGFAPGREEDGGFAPVGRPTFPAGEK